MRLLNIHTLKLEGFPRSRPHYAIASHRWGDVEPSFQDVQARRNLECSGYQKIEHFAAFVSAHVHDVHYLWIDTCCIDRTNSQELQEAVTAMYQWYEGAAVCLAYLNDVTKETEGFLAETAARMQESIWFRRGWTLQELLAPRLVLFLSSEWRVLGHKIQDNADFTPLLDRLGPRLNSDLASITGIPEAVIAQPEHRKSISVDERLEWMARRTTTRPEDMAYSLLGLFEVSLSLMYGEGQLSAERRLKEAIAGTSIDLARLSVAQGAIHSSYEEAGSARCLEGTRTQLLERISLWSKNPESKRIGWLCGMAGTGKSTIARTVANMLDRQQSLGASFFFKRGGGDRGNASRFFPTIAKQLADRIPGLGALLAQALASDSSLCDRNLQEQFRKLIELPFLEIDKTHSWLMPLTVVIDGLDECEPVEDVRLLLALFARVSAGFATRVRLFITSRPELPIKAGFQGIPESMYQAFVLEEIQSTTIQRDIRLYFDHCFAKITTENQLSQSNGVLPTNWPGADQIDALVKLATPLFISASTICSHIAEDEHTDRLEQVLHPQQGRSLRGLERTYAPILERLLQGRDEHEQEKTIADVRTLLGSIVLLADPLSAQSLSRLLGVSLAFIDHRLKGLDSVLSIPSSSTSPIRSLHTSLCEYLTDSEVSAQNPFEVDKNAIHHHLAMRCLELLSQPGTLRKDVCDVEQPGTRRNDIDTHHVTNHLSADVAYACSFWTYHLVESGQSIDDDGPVWDFLQEHLCIGSRR